MLIALDYDGTYTEDPGFWDLVISAANHKGHRVVIATMRHEAEMEGIAQQLLRRGVQRVICTGRKAKQPFLGQQGVEPDVWIDDEPRFLLYGA